MCEIREIQRKEEGPKLSISSRETLECLMVK